MKLAELFGAAHQLLSDPEKWTTAVYARDAHGRKVHPSDPSACRWDLEGAIAHVNGGAAPIDALRRLDTATLKTYAHVYPEGQYDADYAYFRDVTPSCVNDREGLHAALRVLETAAQAAQEDGV